MISLEGERGGKVKRYICALLLCALVLPGCFRKQEEAAVTSTKEYDMEAAAALIDKTEWICAWLTQQSEISRPEAEKLINTLNSGLANNEGENIVFTAMADGADWEDETLETIALGNGTVLPVKEEYYDTNYAF